MKIQVINHETGHIAKEIDVSGKTDRQIKRIRRKILLNTDNDRFYLKYVEGV